MVLQALRLCVLLIAVGLLASGFLPRGGTPAPALGCTYLGPATNRSCIQPPDFTDYLEATNTDSSHHFAVYSSNSGAVCSANPAVNPYCLNLEFTTPPDTVWIDFGFSTKAVLCNGQQGGSGNFIDVAYAPFSGFGSASAWFMGYDTGGTVQYYQVPPNCGNASLGFVNHTTAGSYASFGDLCSGSSVLGSNAGIHNGDSIEAPAMPTGVPYWTSEGFSGPTCKIINSGVTLTLDSGFKMFGGSCDGGAGGEICINAANVTVNGAGATVGLSSSGNNQINMLADTGVNPTFNGASGNPLVMDCQGLSGQAQAGAAAEGFQSGRRVGLVTVSHMKIQNCGNIHAIYLGWGPSGAVPSDPTYCHAFTDVVVKDVYGDAPAIKFDDTCGNQQGTAVNIAVYCTIEGNPSLNCDENQPYDNQCGGWHSITDSYFEMYGQPGSNDQWVFAKLNWGPFGIQGCPNTPGVTNSIRFDKDVFTFDGFAYAPGGLSGGLVVICGSAHTGNDCNANAATASTTSSSTLTIGTGTVSLTVGTGIAAPQSFTISQVGTPANFMKATLTSYNSSTGALVGTVYATGGSGTASSWNVVGDPHVAVCVTNSQLVGNYTSITGVTVPFTMGPGVYVDSGCTGSGPDTNTYYATSNGSGGRAAVCSQTNWSAGSGTNCAWPFVPAYLSDASDPHDKQVEMARAAGFCGEGTNTDPIRECDPIVIWAQL